ncbi:MAG: GAF domain-containing sensor histidine kinase [Candidatus Dormibacteraeota bacterium]|nr:GAF domain-containing sensor histidine kinase [Candidatus Dormibacteraeota bacterium]
MQRGPSAGWEPRLSAIEIDRTSALLSLLLAWAIVLPAIFFRSLRLQLDWFVPVADIVAIGCLLICLVMSALDAVLRRETRSLPILAISVALGVLWTIHFLVFPGTIPGGRMGLKSEIAAWIFLSINLVTPAFLAVTFLYRSRPLRSNPRSAVVRAAAAGAAVGLGAGFLDVLLAASPITAIVKSDSFTALASLLGAAGLVPVIFALGLFLTGHRGDERVVNGVVAALVYAGAASCLMVFVPERFTTMWYAVHTLPALVAAALLTGELALYERSARLGVATAERLAIGVAAASDLGRSLEAQRVAARVLGHSVRALDVQCGFVGLLRGDVIEVRAAEGGSGEGPAPGTDLPVPPSSFLARTIAAAGPVIFNDAPDWPGTALGPAGSLRVLSAPLSISGRVIGVLALCRSRGDRFQSGDLETMAILASLAALALQNATLYEASQEASQSKDTFLNMTAHELRTPLAVVTGYLSMLTTGDFGAPPPNWARPMAILQAKVTELARLVEGVIAASKLEANMLAPLTEPVNLNECVRAAVERALPAASMRGGRVRFGEPDEVVLVDGDHQFLGRILDNLIMNGLNYSSGKPEIQLLLEQEGESVQLLVSDRGVGVPDDKRETIFERFTRIDHSELGYPPGTGLGLYLSRSLAEKMGGRLELQQSKAEEGSVFCLTLRVRSIAHDSNPAPAASASTATPVR